MTDREPHRGVWDPSTLFGPAADQPTPPADQPPTDPQPPGSPSAPPPAGVPADQPRAGSYPGPPPAAPPPVDPWPAAPPGVADPWLAAGPPVAPPAAPPGVPAGEPAEATTVYGWPPAPRPQTDPAMYAGPAVPPPPMYGEPTAPANAGWRARPATGSQRSLPVIVLAVAMVLLALSAATVIVLRSTDRSDTGDTASDATHPDPVTATLTTDPTRDPSPGPTTEAVSTTDPEQAALAELERLHEQDRATVTPAGQFVAQIASKYPGITDPLQTAADGSHLFRASDILAEHQRLRERHSDGGHPVILLKSTDYGRRQLVDGQPLWVTFAVGDFPDEQSVLNWCASHFADLSGDALTNQCDARTLRPTA